MHIVYIVTSETDQKCGVVDYTRQLASSMKDLVPKVTIEELPIWSFTELFRLRKKYKNEKEIIFHIQYPTIGMGKSFAPALLSFFMKRRSVYTTFHEFEQFNVMRKLYFFVTSLLDNRFIFTNTHEEKIFTNYYPWSKNKSEIIPIGNNITPVEYAKKIKERDHRLIYFGQIAPNKGIEQFLATVREMRNYGSDITCAIIGATLGSSVELLKKIEKFSAKYNIECIYNLSSRDVSKELHESTIAYLPFPGGISDKRGSALACLKHNLCVISIHSEITPQWWKNTTYCAENTEQAINIIEEIYSERKELTPDPLALSDAMSEREWGNIALAHQNLYKLVD